MWLTLGSEATKGLAGPLTIIVTYFYKTSKKKEFLKGILSRPLADTSPE